MNKIFTKKEKIKFKHIDNAGIVFYPRFLEMLNDLVEDWFEEELKNPFATMHKTHGIPTVDLKVQFKSPARLGEIITKKLWVKELKNAAIICGFEYVNQLEKTVLEGEVTLVYVKISEDRNHIKSCSLEGEILELLKQFVIN
jgi:4-hydroxybenzoyl-CoA thioesterase